jgi:NADPH:quinone reductase-like Zn-dependent oxidoreductase
MADMFAVVAERIGGPEVIRLHEQHPLPQPAKNELRIRVSAAGINPIDCARRAGYGFRMMQLLGAAKFPLVLGSDFVGVVDAVGSGVSGWEPGERVFGCKAVSRAGTHAELVTVPVNQVLRLPKSLPAEQAAAIPYSFCTAYCLIEAGLGHVAESFQGRRVLVHGGLGSVGSLATSLLAHLGATVDISDREASVEDAKSRGAASMVDLKKMRPQASTGEYDAILNCAQFQDEEALFPLLKRGGRYATIVHPLIATIDEYGWIRGALRARGVWRRQLHRLRACGGESYRWVLFKPNSMAFQLLEQMAGQGLLRAEIAKVVPAREAAGAHALMAVGGVRGKFVLLLQMS